MWEQGDKGTGRQRRAMNINLSVDYDINDYCDFVEAFGKQMQTYVSIWQSQLYQVYCSMLWPSPHGQDQIISTVDVSGADNPYILRLPGLLFFTPLTVWLTNLRGDFIVYCLLHVTRPMPFSDIVLNSSSSCCNSLNFL